MSFKDIKTKLQAEQGFTIVELLIVIVVIGILAAITIVSYNGITARANANSAKANATSFLKKAELYAADGGKSRYPVTALEVQTAADAGKSFYVNPSLTITYGVTPLTSSNPISTIRVMKCSVGTASPLNQSTIVDGATGSNAIAGLIAYYFDYVNNAEASLSVGVTTNCPASA